jgi:hypothetical protein
LPVTICELVGMGVMTTRPVNCHWLKRKILSLPEYSYVIRIIYNSCRTSILICRRVGMNGPGRMQVI